MPPSAWSTLMWNVSKRFFSQMDIQMIERLFCVILLAFSVVLNSLWLADECFCLDFLLTVLQKRKTNKLIINALPLNCKNRGFLKFFCSVKPYSMSKSWLESKINVAKTQSSAPVQKKSSESLILQIDLGLSQNQNNWLVGQQKTYLLTFMINRYETCRMRMSLRIWCFYSILSYIFLIEKKLSQNCGL